MNHKEDCDIDVQACSTMDCTGLIPSLPQSEAEREAYAHYIQQKNLPRQRSHRPGEVPSFRLFHFIPA